MTQDLAQGACQALEDAVTLGAAIEAADGDYSVAFYLYEKARVPRTARVLYSAREMGRVYHAKGVETLVRNALWVDSSQATIYDAFELITVRSDYDCHEPVLWQASHPARRR